MQQDILLDFIHKRCSIVKFFSNRGVTIKNDSGYTRMLSINARVGCCMEPAHIDIAVVLYHSLLDMYLTSLYGGENTGFYTKYKNVLPSASSVQCIVRECFKVLSLFRNSLVHSTNSLDKDCRGYGKSIKGNTFLAITSTSHALSHLFTIMELYFERARYSAKYLEGALAYCYQELCRSTVVRDRRWGKLKVLNKTCFKFERNIRESFLYSQFEVKSNFLFFEDNCRINLKYDVVDSIRRTDYCFVYNGQTYRVPEEALAERKIALDGLAEWTTNEVIGEDSIAFEKS
ncbi:hypothetical protein [Halodesulfovibrio sp. MK-HDV]|uniref:hypothetical protein n=1 Tax=Halodesulfovibrio sp. MK-HDV TaxID=2599925 RepID=UPI00136C31E0|nr:hypothetical protein [Halodesulfovibrio sp. MK-HDV]KAF1076290.1 hypothetical protein MKHDV_01311 [Halodesulfovibrio sp. MK-HDV]